MIYHVFANRSNAGDWLSAIGIQTLLGNPDVIECFCDTPFVPETLAQLEQATAQDLIIIGGGGLLMDYFQPFWEGFHRIAGKTPFCLWGVGCCEMKWGDTLPARALLSGIAAASQLCVVRDALTCEFLGHSLTGDPIPCPSFAALAQVPVTGGGVLHAASYEEKHPELYEHMRHASLTYAATTHRPFVETNNRLPNSHRTELDRLVEIYAKSDIVLSARLHGCILATAMAKKVVAVSNDRKIESFMQAAGLAEWVLEFPDADRITEALRRAESHQPVSDISSTAAAANRRVAERVLEWAHSD